MFNSTLYAQENDLDLSKILKNLSTTLDEKRYIGVGLMIGEPIGINIKWWSKKAIDLEAAINNSESFIRSWLLSNSSWLPIKNAWVASVAYPIFADGFLHVHLDRVRHKYITSIPKVGIIPIHFYCAGRVRFDEKNI